MRTAITASRILAFKREIEKQLELLRKDACDDLRDATRQGEKAFSQESGNKPVDAHNTAVVAMNLINLSQHAREMQACIEALHRIDEGEFGVCQCCGEDIELNHLRANPLSVSCLRCESAQTEVLKAG